MQFNRDHQGATTPLPKPSIDTGMGLERIAAIVQGVHSNYDSDLFMPLIHCVENLAQKRYGQQAEQDVSLRIIADHTRAIAFLIAEGVLPSNEGRGYVLRRIMRRAARHGKKLGLVKPFLHCTALVVAEQLRAVYPELARAQDYIVRVILNEEETFSATLEAGLKILQDEIEALRQKKSDVISGAVAFKLYDTYGFPIDLTQDIAAEYTMRLDEDGFQHAMHQQRKRARESWKGSGEEHIAGIYKQLVQEGMKTVFTGYHHTEEHSSVQALIRRGELVEHATQGDEIEIATAATCFYGESGGQVGDSGILSSNTGRAIIHDVLKPFPDLFIHRGKVTEGTIARQDEVTLSVDRQKRQATANNHTATHILHAVLRQVLGNHVKQAGSLVSPERLRFDFTHFTALTREELDTIEELVNERIRQNTPLNVQVLPLAEAMTKGATALFGEKYGEEVRVVSIAGYSMELCGGTHNHSTGEIGVLKIVSEAGIAAGVRRIEALTGKEALHFIKRQDALVQELTQSLKTDRDGLLKKVERMFSEQKDLEREISTLKAQLIAKESGSILDKVRDISGCKVLITKVNEGDVKSLREYGDQLKDRLGSGIIVLGADGGGTAQLLAMVTKDIAKQ
jgi:alanyl-tRNA synthetase